MLYIPSRFVEEAQAVDGEVQIEIAGESFPFEPRKVTRYGPIATFPIPMSIQAEIWPANRIGPWHKDSTVLIVSPELSEPMAIDNTRLSSSENAGLKIAPGVPISESLIGSPVISAVDGKMIGLLVKSEAGWEVAYPPDVQ